MPGSVPVIPPPSNGIAQWFPDFDPSPSKLSRESLTSSPEEAITLLERFIADESSPDSVAKFSAYMQLGETYSRLGQMEKSISCYNSALNVQVQAVGSSHPLVADTCRDLAEAHLQAMQFDEAEIYCRKTLDIYREYGGPGSLKEAADRRILALICEAKGDYESALKHLVLARAAMATNAPSTELADVNVNIGNIYSSLGRRDDSVLSYHEALRIFRSTREDNHPSIASVFIRLADVYSKMGKLKESELYCENALRVYAEPEFSGVASEEIARELIEISGIFLALNNTEEALKLLQMSMKLLEGSPGHFGVIAGIEVEMGVIFNLIGRHDDAQRCFESAILKLRVCGKSKSAYFGIVLNQMGLACVQTQRVNKAMEFFEEAVEVLEQDCGPCHSETIAVCCNLAATYDALGRVEEAIELLEYIVRSRQEKLRTANSDFDEEKRRLDQLLEEAGRAKSSKQQKSLEDLFGSNIRGMKQRTNRHYSAVSKLSTP